MRCLRSSFVLIFIFLLCAGAPPPAPVAARPSAPRGCLARLPYLPYPPHLPYLPLLRSRLSGLLLQHLARIADALLLVGIRLAQATDVGGDLADQLSIGAGNR